jgi:hypothetical protein
VWQADPGCAEARRRARESAEALLRLEVRPKGEAHVRKIEADTEGHVFDVFVSFYYEDRREWVSPLNVREFNGTLGYGD